MLQHVSPSGRREVMGGLAKGLEVLRTFSRKRPHMTLSEIAARAGLPAATARRCLNTLEELGYVARSGRQFMLRPPVLEIGAVYLDSMDIPTITRTKLEELALNTRSSDRADRAVRHGCGAGGARLGAHRAAAHGRPCGPAPARACQCHRQGAAGRPHSREARQLFRQGQARSPHGKDRDRPGRAHATDRRRAPRWLRHRRKKKSRPGVASLAVPVHDGAGRVVAALDTSPCTCTRRRSPSWCRATWMPCVRPASGSPPKWRACPGLALSAQV